MECLIAQRGIVSDRQTEAPSSRVFSHRSRLADSVVACPRRALRIRIREEGWAPQNWGAGNDKCNNVAQSSFWGYGGSTNSLRVDRVLTALRHGGGGSHVRPGDAAGVADHGAPFTVPTARPEG